MELLANLGMGMKELSFKIEWKIPLSKDRLKRKKSE